MYPFVSMSFSREEAISLNNGWIKYIPAAMAEEMTRPTTSKITSGAEDDCPVTRRSRDSNRLTVISEIAIATKKPRGLPPGDRYQPQGKSAAMNCKSTDIATMMIMVACKEPPRNLFPVVQAERT